MILQTVARQGMSHKHSCAVPFVLRCEVSSIAFNCDFTCFVVPVFLFVTPAGLSGKEPVGDLVIRRTTFFHADPRNFRGKELWGDLVTTSGLQVAPGSSLGLELWGETGYDKRFPC